MRLFVRLLFVCSRQEPTALAVDINAGEPTDARAKRVENGRKDEKSAVRGQISEATLLNARRIEGLAKSAATNAGSGPSWEPFCAALSCRC